MIYYNSNTIKDWNFGYDNIIKVYRNNAVCYYKVTGGGDTPTAQTPCFAVVDNISQYSDTEFEDVFNKADGKWYKLNNLNQYEEYGVYGSGRTITTYEGKLTIDDGYEYQYSGGSWVNVGEVSGSTATLPDVPFTVNYNAKNYDSTTHTLLKTSGQLADVDAVITAGTPTVNDGYLTISSSTRATIIGYQNYFNRDNNSPNLTIISKQRTEGGNCHMFANRDSNYNWMYRCYSNMLTLHGSGEQGGVAVTTQPVIESVRVDSNRLATYNNYTDNTSSTKSSFSYGGTNSGKFAIFAGYGSFTGEWFVGDFYWVYMSQNTLTDEQVQQVIAYNEGGGGQTVYPVYYTEMQDPPNNLVFSSMTEAEEYECPWVGMNATIDGDKYVFSGDSQSGYEWVYNPSRLPQGYTEVEYVQNSYSGSNSSSTSRLAIQFEDSITNNESGYTYEITSELNVGSTSAYWDFCGNPYVQLQRTDSGYGNMFEPRAWGKHFNANIAGTFFSDIKYKIRIFQGVSDAYPILEITNITAETTNSYSMTATRSNMKNNSVKFGLFSFYNVSDSGAKTVPAKIYELKIYDRENNLLAHAVPCKRDIDGKVGFYNLARDEFEYDASGELLLTAGPTV